MRYDNFIFSLSLEATLMESYEWILRSTTFEIKNSCTLFLMIISESPWPFIERGGRRKKIKKIQEKNSHFFPIFFFLISKFLFFIKCQNFDQSSQRFENALVFNRIVWISLFYKVNPRSYCSNYAKKTKFLSPLAHP